MGGRARGGPAAAPRQAPPVNDTFADLPAGFEPHLLFRERRSSLTLERVDGAPRPPRLVEESGCRLRGAASGRTFALVLDEPDLGDLCRLASRFGGTLREPPPILSDLALAWRDPIHALFDRWERDLGGEASIAGTRMEATVSRVWIDLHGLDPTPAEGAAPAAGGLHAMTARGTLEGRLTVMLRARGRLIGVEASRWADSGARPSTEALASWETAAPEALRRGLDLLQAMPPPAMEAPAVFAPEASGVLLHEICGHLLEADLIVSGVAPFASRIGERIAPAAVTLIDAPLHPGARVQIAMDDEGVQPEFTLLVAGGILRGFLSDRRTASATGGRSTGNGRRESYRHPSLPRMTNLTMSAGPDDPADLVKGIGRGLLVERLGRGQVDPRRGEFRLEVESGRLIEDGAAGRPLAGAFLVGSCRDLLMAIDGVGADVRIDPGAGVCIKDDQIVPVGQATPSVRVARVRVVPGAVP